MLNNKLKTTGKILFFTHNGAPTEEQAEFAREVAMKKHANVYFRCSRFLDKYEGSPEEHSAVITYVYDEEETAPLYYDKERITFKPKQVKKAVVLPKALNFGPEEQNKE